MHVQLCSVCDRHNSQSTLDLGREPSSLRSPGLRTRPEVRRGRPEGRDCWEMSKDKKEEKERGKKMKGGEMDGSAASISAINSLAARSEKGQQQQERQHACELDPSRLFERVKERESIGACERSLSECDLSYRSPPDWSLSLAGFRITHGTDTGGDGKLRSSVLGTESRDFCVSER